MNRIRTPYFSYGTLYGTASDLNPQGVSLGRLDLTGYGLWFVVKDKNDPNGRTIFQKSLGTGIALDPVDNGTNGLFRVTWSSQDVKWPPKEYFYTCFIAQSGTAYSEGTTNIKSIGSGIFEITRGVKVGTV